MTIDWHYTMARLAASLLNTQALIDMRNNDARTVRLRKETLCNNGENKVLPKHPIYVTLHPQDNFSWVPNFSLGFPECETKLA